MAISTAVDTTAVARVVGIQTAFKDLRGGGVLFLPQRVAIVGQGSTTSVYATTKKQITSALDAGQTYGFGSPVHLAALQLLPTNGDGVGSIPVTVYPLTDAVGSAAAVGDITPSGAATGAASFVIKINNIASEQFSVAAGNNVATIVASMLTAVSASLNLPMTGTNATTKLTLTSKWKGASANGLKIEVVATSQNLSGITFAITQPVGGLVNPSVTTATSQIGDVWETMVLNCLEISDTVALDAFSTFGEGRWGALTRKPLVVFTGNTISTVALATAVSDTRKTDRTNAQLVSPGSLDLPFVVAARQLARIAKIANDNPPRDYGSQEATGLTPGADGVQWAYTDRDSAVKKGSSTVEVKDGVVNLSDIVTFYHPTGDPIPAYRYVCDIVKVQNIIFNLSLIFAAAEWAGAPLIPDDQPTVNPTAKQPKMAKSAVNSMIDSLALEAILSDPKTAKANTVAQISSQNPKRLDIAMIAQLSGNTNIISVDLNFGFYFGGV